MKRYRVHRTEIDGRPVFLSTQIQSGWEQDVIDNWVENKTKMTVDFVLEFGILNHEVKLKDYVDFGPLPFSVIAYHNKFLRQVRNSFVTGGYYPALTGTCALGERILNHLIINLRDYYKSTPEYKRVYKKDSFDNWDIPITTLENWKILLPEGAIKFRELAGLRNQAIHFRPETDEDDREMALQAVHLCKEIIQIQFGGNGSQPWFIPGTKGAFFIKKKFEDNPFVKELYLPNSILVGPYHKLDWDGEKFIVVSDEIPEDKEISDDEYAKLFSDRRE